MLERLGDNFDKPLFALALSKFRLPEEIPELATPNFLCLLAADFTKASDADIAVLSERLLALGASYFVCWGPGCERAHDLINDVALLAEAEHSDDSVVMTTWHDDASLEEALLFVLRSAWPDRAYEDSTGCTLAVSVANAGFAEKIRSAFSEPVDFVARLCA